jgi:hypothetical protein
MLYSFLVRVKNILYTVSHDVKSFKNSALKVLLCKHQILKIMSESNTGAVLSKCRVGTLARKVNFKNT